MNYGFFKAAAAVPRQRVADCAFNASNITGLIKKADEKGVKLVVFPELSVTSYTCSDLFHQQTLLRDAETQLGVILNDTAHTKITAVVGLPVQTDSRLYNCAAVIHGGRISGVVPKTHIPNYKEFYEERWFASGSGSSGNTVRLCGQEVPFGTDLLFEIIDEASKMTTCFGIEICEDLWVPIPPSSYQAVAGAQLLLNLSASDENIGKYEYREELVRQQSGKCIAGYVYTSSGVDESTTDVVYGGHALIAENGGILAESECFKRDEQLIITEIDIERLMNDRFKNTSFSDAVPDKSFRKIDISITTADKAVDGTFFRYIDPHPFVPSDETVREKRCSEIFSIQTTGLARRLSHTGSSNAVLGISGGLDSTLALLVTAKTFDILKLPRKNITAVTMPGFGTTDLTYDNALKLMRSLGTDIREINIKEACLRHFKDIGHDPAIHDVTYENVQARERTQILMDIANKQGGLVIGTGDLSELALGWCTYNGDHMSMYAVNCGIPKTLVKFLVKWVAGNVSEKDTAQVLESILATPITPELLPPDEKGRINQKTEDIIGPYELHDFFLYHMVRYGASPRKILFLAEKAFDGSYTSGEIKSWLKVFYKRFFSQQFKRSCLPDGPKVGSISLSPRGDWRMPSDASAESWLKELD